MTRNSDTAPAKGAAHGAASGSAAVSLASLGGWRALFVNPGLVLNTMRHGSFVGEDVTGNRYYQEIKASRPGGRKRRWVVYAGRAREASLVPPEWHAWLHFITDEPLPEQARQPWQRPYLPNQTGSAGAYRPPGHDYEGGVRARATGDYEPWTPDA